MKHFIVVTLAAAFMTTAVSAQQNSDRFLLPQPDKPFEGKIETRIGTLEFSNQYPSKASVAKLLDAMDFQSATQACLWAIPIVSMANFQFYHEQVFGLQKGELMEYRTLEDKLFILTANATTP